MTLYEKMKNENIDKFCAHLTALLYYLPAYLCYKTGQWDDLYSDLLSSCKCKYIDKNSVIKILIQKIGKEDLKEDGAEYLIEKPKSDFAVEFRRHAKWFEDLGDDVCSLCGGKVYVFFETAQYK